MGLKRDGGQRRARVKARSQPGRAKPHKTALRGKSEPRGTGAARTRAPPVWHLPPAIPPLVAAVVSRSSRRRPCANTVGLNAAHARHPSAAACVWCLGHHAAAVVALHCAAPPPPPLRPSSGLVVARAHAHAHASARGGGGGGERRRRIAIARFPRDRFPDGAVSSCFVVRGPWRRVFVVASLSRRDHHESDNFVVARFLEGRGGSERPPRVRPLDRPTDYLTDRRSTRAPLSNGDQPSPRGGCCGRLRRPRRPPPVHAHLDELVVRCGRRRAAAAVVARGHRARTCALRRLSVRVHSRMSNRL